MDDDDDFDDVDVDVDRRAVVYVIADLGRVRSRPCVRAGRTHEPRGRVGMLKHYHSRDDDSVCAARR